MGITITCLFSLALTKRCQVSCTKALYPSDNLFHAGSELLLKRVNFYPKRVTHAELKSFRKANLEIVYHNTANFTASPWC